MRNFLWILMLTSFLSAGEINYAIQVLSVHNQSSITDAFMDRVKEMSMIYTQKRVNGQYKIFLGEFTTYEEAASSLALIRKNVQKDAFITRMAEEYMLDPKQKMQRAMLMAQARTLKKMKQEDTNLTSTKLARVEPIKVSGPEPKIVIEKKDTKTVVAMQEDVKTEKIYCKPSKRALRESEISDALAFYRKSSYYKFVN